jgi:hypothetical protein
MTIEVRDDTVKKVDVGTPTYAPPPPTAVRVEPETSTAGVMTGGASLEAVGGAGAIVLSVLGLAGYLPFLMTAIATIAAGGGLLIHGLAASSRWRRSLGTEALGGAAGVALGILSLVGVMPFVLLPVAAIVLGGSVLLAGSMQPGLARGAEGIDVLVGAGAVVLGILALLHIGSPLTMTMIAMLAIGVGLLVSGGFLAARFGRRVRA